MKSRKKLLCLAVAASLVMGAAFTGCTVINNEEDVKQTVAIVNISKTDAFKTEFAGYEDAITDKVFLKRDMLTAYYNGYYQYVQYGQSYAQVFETIKDSLVSNAVTTQYATVYLLQRLGDSARSTYISKETEKDKYEYILNQYDDTAVARATYSLQSTLNSVLDSAERNIIEDKDDDDEYTGSGTRSTPSGIDTTVEEYIPEGYGVYTGYEGYLIKDMQTAVDNGDYEKLDGSTRVTRQKAYASFLNSLKSNYLLTAEDTQHTNIWELSYVRDSYISQLQSEIVSAWQDEVEKEQEGKINTVEDGVYGYIQEQYASLLKVQRDDYINSSSFESAMGTMSDSKYVLYSPSTEEDTGYDEATASHGKFGYVYNILLPFSSTQETQLSVLQSYRDNDVYTESQYFYERNKLLKNIQTTDQRSAWFNGTTDYSFSVSEYEEETGATLKYYGKTAGRDYLFFKNNVTDEDHKQYEALERYDGRYSYNGTVKKNNDGSYTLVPKKLTIDDMLDEFSAYINYVLTEGAGGGKVSINKTENYYKTEDFTKQGEDKEINYSLLVYATGEVALGEKAGRADMFDATTDRYKAMSAVNELQYAYTTDTGVLSQYIGYTISAYDTNYIKEFEYAAQEAVRKGEGNFAVCAGDYGWHLIYVTETFDTAGGDAYDPSFNEDRVNTKGTFENRFYNWIKDSHLANEVTLKTNTVLKEYNTKKAVTVYADVYKDLSGLN